MDNQISRQFGSLARLYGQSGFMAIQAAHVCIAGIGGVGSWVAESFARSGVGTISLIDMDHVSESNINRQVHASIENIGQSKVVAMYERILKINPICKVNLIDDFVSTENWPKILPFGVDALVDATDQTIAKTAMASWAMSSSNIFISVGAAGGKKLAHLVEIADLSEVTHDPLLAQLRGNIRKFHGGPRDKRLMKITCVFSRESVVMPNGDCDLDGSLNCHGYGSVAAVTSTFGQCAAGWVLNEISKRRIENNKNQAII